MQAKEQANEGEDALGMYEYDWGCCCYSSFLFANGFV